MGQLKFKNGIYWWKGSFEERELVKEYGFLWDEDEKLWYTKNPKAAYDLYISFRREPYEKIMSTFDDRTFLEFQKSGISEIISRPNIMLADDMGLGKTIQTIGAINNISVNGKIFIVCPATVKLHWKKKLLEWLTKYYDIHVARGQTDQKVFDSEYDILIMNYALVPYYKDFLHKTKWGMKIVDEAHYLMNPEAQRTDIILGVKTERNVFLSGTFGEKPIELQSNLKHLDPARWDNFWDYASRYCAPWTDGEGRWRYDGASNLDELQDILRSTIMVRRTKKQVMPQLGDKQKTVIPIEQDEFKEFLRYERDYLSGQDSDYDKAIENLSANRDRLDGLPYATLRREAGIKKAPFIVQYLKDALAKTDKIVCYAFHRQVITELKECFREKCVTVKGGMNATKKDAALERFKNDPVCKLYIGQIKAMGTGTDGLQDVTNVGVFAELDWSYKNMVQAEDRLHRHGQKDISTYHYLVIDESLEAYMAQKLQKKKCVSNKMFDREEVV
jgi:SWI/SNF-related matrix-associated actin-dependent regulator 1 of chromatin subfamily A